MRRGVILTITVLMGFIIGCCPFRKCAKPKEAAVKEESEVQPEKVMPKVKLKFVFSMCNDVEEMAGFYTDLLGMTEQAFYKAEDGSFGYLSYLCEGDVYLMFFSTTEEVPALTDWAWQPGYEGGELNVTSWAIQIPEEDFAETVKRLQTPEVKKFSDTPQWRQDSYWGFTVADPQGNTVEVYTSPPEKPESTEWLAE
ncbi:hypothetical protein GF359_02840 [candidate division WOR-3 bacterium]|uniref:VOC domain-containing protein n=1 Tax=candidate division WOR-3 bacterium TaxID=2052148 RepID=A0A9D5K8P3_UNCW3|nr:hypothetical protein [candidate division WOR-3 bacterium]MBD3364130.1 hypothetical protein [candidate division WOR-3 bacterium]